MVPKFFATILIPCAISIALVSISPADENTSPPCIEQNGITPLCGFQRPEDLEVVAQGRRLLVSEYGSLTGTKPGRLLLFDPVSGLRRVLVPDSSVPAPGGWGAVNCPGPPGPEFSPHGIHHSEIGGADRVLVVNHGGREAVEIFEIINANDAETFALRWRGCVLAPAGIWMNDVVGRPGGGFFVSHMVARDTPEHDLIEAERQRSSTGWVMAWQPTGAWSKVSGSEGGLPNGIEISADGKTLYINEYFGDRVVALDIASGLRRWETEVSGPDNSSWAADGTLLVTSHLTDLSVVFACAEHADQVCRLPYAIVAIRPSDGAAVTLLEGGGDEPMGGATVAVEFGEDLYIGSFTGDRMVRRARPLNNEFPR